MLRTHVKRYCRNLPIILEEAGEDSVLTYGRTLLTKIAIELMMTEYEVVWWANFIDRVELL